MHRKLFRSALVSAIVLSAFQLAVVAQNRDIKQKAHFFSNKVLLCDQYPPPLDGKRFDYFELHMFPGWFKPLCDEKAYKGASRLVLELTKDGKAIINPPEFPDVIELKGLTLETAQMLWGEPRGGGDVKTFDLLSRTKSTEWDIYHLDIEFKNDIANKYRIRGIGITTPEWTSVNATKHLVD